MLQQKDLGLIACLLLMLAVALSPMQTRLDQFLYDQLQTFLANPHTAPQDPVVIEIDDTSLQALGRWPWPRHLHTEMIEHLESAGVRAIAYNVAFVDPDLSPRSDDPALQATLKHYSNITLPVFAERGETVYPFRKTPRTSGYQVGHVDTEVDSDGLVRRFYLKAGIDYPSWPALALSTLTQNQQSDYLPGKRSPLRLNDGRSKWHRDWEVLAPYYTNPKRFPHFRFIDVLDGQVPASQLKDKTVFVGVTATGLESTFMIYADQSIQRVSGTLLEAHLYYSLQQNSLLTPVLPIWGIAYSILLIICSYSALFLVQRLVAVRVMLGGLSLALFSAPMLALHYGYWLSLGSTLTGLVVLTILSLLKVFEHLRSPQRQDKLTDLSSQAMFNETLLIEWEQCLHKKLPLSLIMIEIDYFRRFRIIFGKERSEWVLTRIGSILQNHKRRSRDLVARQNNDRFVILLPVTPLNVASAIAEKIRKDIEELQIEHGGSPSSHYVTVSVGLASYEYGMLSPSKLLDTASTALTNAHAQGGNRCQNGSV